MDDDTLVARMAAGDDAALRELFFRHAPLLAARLRAVLPAADVEDALQETFLAAWRGAARYRPQGACGGWLWAIARRQAALLLRRRGPAPAALTEDMPDGLVAGDASEAVAVRTDLERAVATLGATEQAAWRLMYEQDRPVPPSSGRMRLLGRDLGSYESRREIRRRLGYLPQHLGYYPSFTVAEFVEYFALLKDMPAGRVPDAVAAAVERVDLGGKARAKLRTLSGGMLRRVGIAQAIVNDPELLLLDEPTAGLDPEQRVQFRALLRELGQHATVVVSTHLVEDVGAACTEVALMDAGRIVFHGTPAELAARGVQDGAGDSPLERGYTAALASARVSGARS